MSWLSRGTGPHAGLPVALEGAPLHKARAAVVLLHGRAGNPYTILRHARVLGLPGLALLAPQAEGRSWYPARFVHPLAENAAHLDSAFSVVDGLIATVGLPAEHVALMGFSQGACVSLEYVVRRRLRLGAVIALSGGLMGAAPPDPAPEPGLAGLPVLLAGAREDRQIPLARVLETEDALGRLGAAVTLHLRDGDLHGVTEAERRLAAGLLTQLSG